MKIASPTYSIRGVSPQNLHQLQPTDLRGVLDSMDKPTEATFVTRFNAEWNSLDPQTRKRMLGGASGGVIAGSATVAALSVRQIQQLIGNRPMFVFAMAVLGTGIGALAPDAIANFKSGKIDWESPSWWSFIFGKAGTTVNFNKDAIPAAPKSSKAKTKSQK